MPRRSRPSGRPSTTSPRPGSKGAAGPVGLRALVEGLPPEKLDQALAHPSWTADRLASYERLEFLGDSVLGFAVTRLLFERFPDFSEGRMTRIRADLVSRAGCAVAARELGLDAQLAVRGEGLVAPDELERLVASPKVLAAMFEAVVAAVYLHHGFEAAQAAIVAAFLPRLDYALTNPVDHKTELQEALAQLGRQVVYAVLETDGPAHERLFTCAALIDGEQFGVGTGRSKKDAEQIAAQEALGRLGADGLLAPTA